MTDWVCATCGSTRLDVIQRGLDNFPIALCFACRDRKSLTKGGQLIAVIQPVISPAAYKARERAVEAAPDDMWRQLSPEEQKRLKEPLRR